jgi:hypothetical protein
MDRVLVVLLQGDDLSEAMKRQIEGKMRVDHLVYRKLDEDVCRSIGRRANQTGADLIVLSLGLYTANKDTLAQLPNIKYEFDHPDLTTQL